MDSTLPLPQPLLFKPEEAAARLGVSVVWLKREVAARRVPHRRHGRLTKFTEADVQAIAAGMAVKPFDGKRRPA